METLIDVRQLGCRVQSSSCGITPMIVTRGKAKVLPFKTGMSLHKAVHDPCLSRSRTNVSISSSLGGSGHGPEGLPHFRPECIWAVHTNRVGQGPRA